MDFNPELITQIGSAPAWATFFALVGWMVKTWPHWKEKVNEARKIQLDADGERLTQAFTRIRELEEIQSKDRREHHEALSNERRRCDAELDDIRARLSATEQRETALLAMIRQNSQSTAHMIGRRSKQGDKP